MSNNLLEKDHSRREDCLKLITHSAVMTLATRNRESAWSAPVYYLFTDGRFYFFSNPDSRHVQEGESRVCGASIFRDDPCFENLEGIQMSGRIAPGGKGMEAAKAALAYCRRHGIKLDIPGDTGSASLPGNILTVFASAYHARLYCFEPDQVFYMDNSRGFGNRIQVEL